MYMIKGFIIINICIYIYEQVRDGILVCIYIHVLSKVMFIYIICRISREYMDMYIFAGYFIFKEVNGSYVN